jgi:hypothetical protein
MPRGFLTARIDEANPRHHLWNNNGTWWCHFVLEWGHFKRRIRRSLKTSHLETAIARRDELFARLRTEGEEVPERRPRRPRRKDDEEARSMPTVLV